MLEKHRAWLPLTVVGICFFASQLSLAASAPPSWAAIEQLIKDQKMEAAREGATQRLAAARHGTDTAEWTRALVTAAQLEESLHGNETAVALLQTEPWPNGDPDRLVLELVDAQAILHYLQTYGYEIRQREKVSGAPGTDLKRWSMDQLVNESRRVLQKAWARREQLGHAELDGISRYLTKNSYPANVRGTQRDALSYLVVQSLVDTSQWTPEEQNGASLLDLDALLGSAAPPAVKLDDSAQHPLQRAVAVLEDLEAWHTAKGERAAAMEARYTRLRTLFAVLTDHDAQQKITHAFEQYLADKENLDPWWSVGMASLAQMLETLGAPGRGHALATRGAQRYPKAIGGQQCDAVAHNLEAPSFSLSSMRADGPGKRSLAVEHKNLARLYFRAWRVDVLDKLKNDHRNEALSARTLYQAAMKDQAPLARWSSALAPTHDFEQHRTYVTPPLPQPGTYVIASSAREDFASGQNQVFATLFTVSDLVVFSQVIEGHLHVSVVSGASGEPVPDANLQIFDFDYQHGHRLVARGRTNARGDYDLSGHPSSWVRYTVVAEKAGQLTPAWEGLYLYPEREPPAFESSLVYTDRSVYRPLQRLQWKVVAYAADSTRTHFNTLARRPLTVTLMDANGQSVLTADVTTNGFGSAAGEFVIPSGRLLGAWSVRTSMGDGNTSVRVEEYKRPTFEVSVEAPTAALRLNRSAKVDVKARYYFGLPVTAGKVAWRVTREPLYPGWWFWFHPPAAQGQQIIAAGKAPLDADGLAHVEFLARAKEGAGTDPSITYRYVVHADITDEGGETRSAERGFRLGVVSVEARLDLGTAFGLAGKARAVEVLRSDLDGAPRTGNASYRLVRLSQPGAAQLPSELPVTPPVRDAFLGARESTPGDLLAPRTERTPALERVLASWKDGAEVSHGDLRHDAGGKATLQLPGLPAGAYRLHYRTEDAFGAKYERSDDFFVAGAQTPLAVMVAVAQERSSVPAGETARVFVHSGFAGQPIRVERYRDGKRVSDLLLHAGKDADLLELPVKPEDRGGFSVRVFAVRDHQIFDQQLTFMVPRDDRELHLTFSTFRDKLVPGGKETFRVDVRGPKGASVDAHAAELLAYMFDKSLDLFGGHSPTNPLNLYAGDRGLPRSDWSLGAGDWEWVVSNGFGAGRSVPMFSGDSLHDYDGRAIGGMGYRRYGGYPGAPMRMAMPTAAPVASKALREAPVDRARMQKKDAEPEMEGGKMNAMAYTVTGQPPAPPPPPPAQPTAVRSNFAETAFWQPQLTLDPRGGASFVFTVPDSVTAWHVWAHALTHDFKAGSIERDTRSVKDLMVRPYLPRFVREGDVLTLKVSVDNASDHPERGTLALELTDAETHENLAHAFHLDTAPRPFSVEPGKSQSFSLQLTAPPGLRTLSFKAVGTSGALSDGEQRPLPVLPSRLHLAESHFAALKPGKTRVLEFPALARSDDPTRENEKLVVTVNAQLFDTVLQALPYLTRYPYECTEQTLNRFVSTGIVSSLLTHYPALAARAKQFSERDTQLESFDQQDANRTMTFEESPWLRESRGGSNEEDAWINVLDARIAQAERDSAVAKLRKSQLPTGAFPWWPGGPPSAYMTLYLVHGFAQASEFQVPIPREMVQSALAYLASEFASDWKRHMADETESADFIGFLAYTLSAFKDPSLVAPSFSAADRALMLDYAFKRWRKLSPYSKGLVALTLHRAGRDADAHKVFDSVMDSAKTTEDEGTYWAREDRSWLWYEDTIETQAYSLRALLELSPKDARVDGIALWLFLNKKLNHWKSTRATAEVLYSLAQYLQKRGGLGGGEAITVTSGSVQKTFTYRPDHYEGRQQQLVLTGAQITPAQSRIEVTKEGAGFAFASATWHYATDQLPREEAGDLFHVSRRYFRRVTSGKETVLQPLTDGGEVGVGDQVEVQLSIRARSAAEYVQLRDPRAAGLEPEAANSGYHWDLGLVWYEEVRDSATNFFFEALPAGEYTLKYRLRAANAGKFRVGPATLQSMYAPEFTARSAGELMMIKGSAP